MPANSNLTAGRLILYVAAIGGAVGVTYVASQLEFPWREVGPAEQARCTNQSFTCTAFTPPGSPFRPATGRPYAALIVAGLKCPSDGGIYRVLPIIDPELILDPALCVETAPDAGFFNVAPRSTALGEDEKGCACKRGSFCFLTLEDGGIGFAPWGETLPFHGSTGADCFPKVCGEYFGITSWPDECPTTRPLFDGGIPVFDGGLE